METVEQSRIEAVRELGLLDTPPEERFDRVVRLAKRLFDVPTVAVNLIDDDRLFVKSAVGGADAGTSMPLDLAFCRRTVETREALVMTDARLDRDWADHPLVTGEPGIVFYAAWPLAGPGGQVVGALCLIDQQPRALSHGDAALLDDLARWVETELAADADAVQAMEIQRRLLPQKPPDVFGYDIAGRCQPAFNVGGDYYDWHLLDDTMLQITVADVMGKGLAAAQYRGRPAYGDAGHVAGHTCSSPCAVRPRACRTTSACRAPSPRCSPRGSGLSTATSNTSTPDTVSPCCSVRARSIRQLPRETCRSARRPAASGPATRRGSSPATP